MSDWILRGQVLQVLGNRILVHLSGLDDDIRSDWIPIPSAMPQWAQTANGPVFKVVADIDDTRELTFEYLRQNPTCLRDFTCKPIPRTLDWLLDECAE